MVENAQFVKKKPKVKMSTKLFIIGMLAGPVINWLVFWLYVNLSSFALAFQNNIGEWSLINFPRFWDQLTSPYGESINMALKNTFRYFAVDTFILFPLQLIVSYFLYKRILGFKAFRTIFFFPSIISGVVLTTVYSNMIASYGPVGKLLTNLGVEIPLGGFLNNSATATPAIIIYCAWTAFSGTVILMTGAMSRVPVEVLESAKLDGCPAFTELIQLILPLIWSSLSTLLIFQMTGVLGAGGPILLFKEEGGHDTVTLSFWIFRQVYGTGQLGGTGNYGLVSCAGLIFTFISVPIILAIRWLIEKVPAVEY